MSAVALVPGSFEQVGALLKLRASSLRGRARTATTLGLAALPLVGILAVLTGLMLLPADGAENAVILSPTAWLGFLLTSAVAAASTGARTLLPRDQSAVFPISPLAEHLGTLVLAPLNAAWLVQVFALLTLSGWGFRDSGTSAAGLVMTVLWIVTCTALAQVVGWAMELARTTVSGPWVLRGLGLAAAAGAAVAVVTGSVGGLLDNAPTVRFVSAGSDPAFWSGTAWDSYASAGGLIVATAAFVGLGAWLVAVLQRRTPRDQTRMEARRYPRREQARSDLALALRLDRASIWRSAPLRRGLITLAAIPGGAAALAGLEWHLLVLLPGLAASGAGLLFGVNALALDSTGAVWRASMPGDARTWLMARLIVVAEVCLLAGAEAGAIGVLRAPGWPSSGEAAAVLGASVATTALIVGRCARWSLMHPYSARLRDSRDHPAPPAAMAGYSLRLALMTTFTGLAFSVFALSGRVLPSVLVSLACCLLAARDIVWALRRWDDADERSRVIAAVAA